MNEQLESLVADDRQEMIATAIQDRIRRFVGGRPEYRYSILPVNQTDRDGHAYQARVAVLARAEVLASVGEKGKQKIARILNRALTYYQAHVQHTYLDPAGCADVAYAAMKDIAAPAGEERWGVVSVSKEAGRNLPFFDERRFNNHFINSVSGEGMMIGVDFTAEMNMDSGRGEYQLFVVVESSKDALMKTLEALYDMR